MTPTTNLANTHPADTTDPPTFRNDLRAWLEDEEPALRGYREQRDTLAEQVALLRQFQRVLFDADWLRYGWSVEIGGRGGGPWLRAILAEELAWAGYPPPFSFALIETLAPAVAAFGPAELAATVIPPLLSGADLWCQGFSEPEAGSDLASLRTRAVADGDTFRISGQKVWTTVGHFADRCVLLARTGTPEARHRGITAFFIDMDTPGIETRPLRAMTGEEEFAEMFLDDVVVPADRVIGAVNGAWDVIRLILACERGAFGVQRYAWMQRRLSDLLQSAGESLEPATVGHLYASLYGVRLCTGRSLRSLSEDRLPGPEGSIDKLMISSTEQALFNAAFEAMRADIVFGDRPAHRQWRSEFLFSRAASIYGGTSEIQRDIIAERLLGLPRAPKAGENRD